MSDGAKLIRDRVIFGLIIFGILLGGYHFFYKPLVQAAENAEAFNRQNVTALTDEMSKKADSLQVLASRVTSLNDTLSREKRRAGYWSAVASDMQIIIDDLRNNGQGVATSGEDSVGSFYQVKFVGHKGILNYDGYTRYYSSENSFYSLNAWFDSIFVQSTLFQDVDEVWKIRTVSLSPGVKLRAKSTIDSSIYVGLRAAVQDEIHQSLDFLPPFGVEASLGVLYDMKEQKLLPDVSVVGYYKDYYIGYHPLIQRFSGGLRYRFDIGNFIERIF